MSKDPMQRLSDLEAKNEQLQEESAALKAENRALKSATLNHQELALVINTASERSTQNLIEGFTGRFAAHVLPSLDMFKNRVEKLEQRLAETEEREQALDGKFDGYKAHVETKLDETVEKQRTMLNAFSNALKKHYARHDETIAAMQASADSCNNAAKVTASIVSRCTNLDKDYAETTAVAKREMSEAARQMRHNLTEFTREIQESAEEAVEPAMRQLRHLSDSQLEWRFKWTAFGLALCLGVCIVASWALSPSPGIMRDAARWRNWQLGFTKEQVEKLNNLMSEIEKEDAARKAAEEQQKKQDQNTPLGSD